MAFRFGIDVASLGVRVLAAELEDHLASGADDLKDLIHREDLAGVVDRRAPCLGEHQPGR